MVNGVNESRLMSYLNGELDSRQAAEVEAWYDASEENKRLLEHIYFMMFVGDRLDAVKDIDVDSSYRELQHRIAVRRRTQHSRLMSFVVRYAAVIVLGVLLVGSIVVNRYQSAQMCTVYSADHSCTVVLPDGSSVTLEPESSLSYPKGFAFNNRVTQLKGEAYFKVAKHQGKQFKVLARGTEIVVRGTEFNFKAYDDVSNVEAVLVTGAVDFVADGHKTAIRPNQKIIFNTTDKRINVCEVDTSEELSSNCRSFNDVQLSDIIAVVNKYYHTNVLLSQTELSNIKFTGTIDFDNTFNHNIEVVTLSTETRYTTNGDKIELHR